MGFMTEEKLMFSVKLCKKCSKCYEVTGKNIHNGKYKTVYHLDFPTIGAERKDCPNCNENIDDYLDDEYKQTTLNEREE